MSGPDLLARWDSTSLAFKICGGVVLIAVVICLIAIFRQKPAPKSGNTVPSAITVNAAGSGGDRGGGGGGGGSGSGTGGTPKGTPPPDN